MNRSKRGDDPKLQTENNNIRSTKITSTRSLCKENGSLQDRMPSKKMSEVRQKSQQVHFAKEFAEMPSDRNMLRKMSGQIPSRIPSDEDEVVVNWSSGVVKTNVGDARDSSVSTVVQNSKESERASNRRTIF